MAYIQPNTDIYLLSGINWTNNYEDTVFFQNRAVQLNFMKSYITKTYPAQSYQRHSKNSLRILETADKIYNCNYLMFQNKSYGTKWFYAFITNCEYINDNTTEITYEIDEIQTWFWDLQLGQCFVEREIPETDGLYENLVPENLETGEYIINTNVPTNLGEPCYIACCATNYKGKPSVTELTEWTIPLKYYGFVANDRYDPEGISNNIRKLIELYYNDDNSPENIISILGVPSMLVSENGETTPVRWSPSDPAFKPNDDLANSIKLPNHNLDLEWYFDTHLALNGYIPKNNKLHTYPYSFIQVSNNNGQINTYKWEEFNVDLYTEPRITFRVLGTYYGLPTMLLVPQDYNGIYLNFDEAIPLANFPSIPWITDTYKAYLAQNKASITTSILANAVSGLFSLISGANSAIGHQAINNNIPNTMPTAQISSEMGRNSGIINGISGAVNSAFNIAGILSKISDVKQQPDTVHGLTQCDMLLTMVNKQRFDVYTKSVKAEMAKIIDDYFSAYGYAQHKFKIPNINARPFWSYVQTKGCILKGSCPANTKSFISKCFDKGIRFWANNDNIGNYDLNNSPRR